MTGVQTCALPISRYMRKPSSKSIHRVLTKYAQERGLSRSMFERCGHATAREWKRFCQGFNDNQVEILAANIVDIGVRRESADDRLRSESSHPTRFRTGRRLTGLTCVAEELLLQHRSTDVDSIIFGGQHDSGYFAFIDGRSKQDREKIVLAPTNLHALRLYDRLLGVAHTQAFKSSPFLKKVR